MLTRHHYPSVSLMAQPTLILETKPFGFEGVDLDWIEKRQCTAQITLFADGKARIKPLLIFREKGKRISLEKRLVTFMVHATIKHYILINNAVCLLVALL